jgi:AraC family transcriptional regulator of adaptative response/methylated-DNA-[protein]-cysteine methyltransferase
MKSSLTHLSRDYDRIRKAIQLIDENFKTQPNLNEMAKYAGMSPYYFQRTFRRWAGISPKRFLQFLTKEYVKDLLKNSNILDASYDAGLSGPSRLHDLFIHFEAMTPGEYKEKGRGLKIEYGFHPTPFGECLIAVTPRGICHLSFIEERRDSIDTLRKNWTNATITIHQERTKAAVQKIFTSGGQVNLLCGGTNFQTKVWEALLKIPRGSVVTYKMLAEKIGCPKASRAVGSAVGKNSIAYLIPCHRVIRGVGQVGQYRWGAARKKAMLGLEAAGLGSN